MSQIHARIPGRPQPSNLRRRSPGRAARRARGHDHCGAFTGAPNAGKKFSVEDLPSHDIPWDDSISLRREDMYGDDGR